MMNEGSIEVDLPPSAIRALTELAEEHMFKGGNLVDNDALELAIEAFQIAGAYEDD